MLNFKLEQQGEVETLAVEGGITIQHAIEFKTALLKSFDSVDHVRLNFGKVTEVDLSCLQLLCAAHLTSGKAKKRLTITGCAEPFKKAVLEADYSHIQGCVLECENNCFMNDT